MRFTDEQVENYLHFLNPGTKDPDRKVRCRNCQRDKFFVESGYNFSEECGMSQGHVVEFYDQKECERLHFRQRSIYQRKYHYKKKKIGAISNKFGLILTEEEK